MVFGIIIATGASVTAGFLVVQVAVLPLLFRYNRTVKRKVVFSNCINYPRNLNYDSPSSSSITGGRNFSIYFQSVVDDCAISLGVWHIKPRSAILDPGCNYHTTAETSLQELKTTKRPVVLYCHGNSNHRASTHRLQMYKVFQELNFNTITFDYRGYGDSTRTRPTERGVVEDVFQMYLWLLNSLDDEKPPTIIIWGHSLGTAIAASMLNSLQDFCKGQNGFKIRKPDALVLEAPFNNLKDEIASHPLSKLVSWLPYFKDMFIKPFEASSEYAFTTDEYLSKVTDIPILMLHCKSDKIVPYELAVKLHCKLVESRKSSSAPLVFHTFERGLGLGHNNLCESRCLKKIVLDFLQIIDKNRTQ